MRVPQDHILHLKVPNVPKGEEVEVLVFSKTELDRTAKIAMIAEAAHDPLYRRDMEDTSDDFGAVDFEHL